MATARLNTVKSARKPGMKCGVCQTPIEKGMPYVWWKFRFGGRYIRCMAHKPQAWERESNSKRQDLMRASDALDNARSETTATDAINALTEARDYAESAKDEFDNAVQSWTGTNLEYSENYQNFESAVSELEDFISDVEDAMSELESLDEPDEAAFEDDPDGYDDAQAEYESDLQRILDDIPDVPDPSF